MRRNDNWNDDRGEFRDPDRSRFRDDGPDAIEAHIRRTRSDMDETIDELARRLEPARLLGDVWHSIRGRAGGAGDAAASAAGNAARSAGSTLFHQAARHPVPSALIGAGLVWMITEQARGSQSRQRSDHDDYDLGPRPGRYPGGVSAWEDPGDVDPARYPSGAPSEYRGSEYRGSEYGGPEYGSPEYGSQEHSSRGGVGARGRQVTRRAGQAAEQVSSRASHAASQAAHRAGESMHRVTSAARGMGDRAGDSMTAASRRASRTANHAAQNIADTASHTYERYPLGVALAAMGAGLLAGMAAPNSRRENRWMGETSGRLRRQAAGAAREQAAEAIETGSERVAHAAESAAERAERAAKGGSEEHSHSQSSEGQNYGQEHSESGEGGRMAGQTESGYGSQVEPRH